MSQIEAAYEVGRKYGIDEVGAYWAGKRGAEYATARATPGSKLWIQIVLSFRSGWEDEGGAPGDSPDDYTFLDGVQHRSSWFGELKA